MIEQEKQKKSKKKWILVGVLSLLGAGMIVVGAVSILRMREEVVFEDRGLPIINIELNGVELAEIHDGPKDVKYEGNELDLYEGNEILRYNDVEIKGRGNSTWGQPKRPYQIRFSKGVDLLGMGKAKKWILLANYVDASFVRNDVALALAEMLDVQYSNRGSFVELYINGEYIGLYYLVQKIEIAKGSVDLRGGGGVLFEIDTLHKDEEACYTSYLNECLVVKDVNSNNSERIIESFLVDFNNAEMMVEEGNYEGLAEILDIDSFVKYFLVNEFTVNPDAYSTSLYLYRSDNGKIVAGPVWDFDLSLANREWGWQVDDTFFSPYENVIRKKEAFGEDGLEEDLIISKLFYKMMEMPEFRTEVERIFNEKMSGRGQELLQEIWSDVEKINLAAKVDGEKWKRANFETELIEVIKWISERYWHFEREYGDGSVEPRQVV